MLRTLASLLFAMLVATACAGSDGVGSGDSAADAEAATTVPFATSAVPPTVTPLPTAVPPPPRADIAEVRNDDGDVDPQLVAAYFTGRQMSLTDEEVACVVAGIEDRTLLEVDLSRQVYFPDPSCISGETVAATINRAFPGDGDLLGAEQGSCLIGQFRDQLGFEAAMARCVGVETFGEFMVRIDDGDVTVPEDDAQCVLDAINGGASTAVAMEACIGE